MTPQDWDEYKGMRKMYTPEAWAQIEKAIAGEGSTFNIAEFVLDMSQKHTQVNIAGS